MFIEDKETSVIIFFAIIVHLCKGNIVCLHFGALELVLLGNKMYLYKCISFFNLFICNNRIIVFFNSFAYKQQRQNNPCSQRFVK